MSLSGCPLDIVDVFAGRPLAGNPLAVVRVERMPTQARRQALARETNLSETTFVATRPDGDGHWPVRIHTPAEELPFAGHPTLGTAWIVRRHLAPGELVVLATGVGAVAVRFDGAGDDALAWLDAPAVATLDAVGPERVAAAVGLPLAAMHAAPEPRAYDVGPRFVLAELRSRDDLAAAAPDTEALRALLAPLGAVGAVGVLLVAPAGAGEGDLAARMFFDAAGVREDPATGSAACCLAERLRAAGRSGPVTLTQGVDMQRPSILHIDLGADGVRVGGQVCAVLAGIIDEGLDEALDAAPG